jgi:hypothetical protein
MTIDKKFVAPALPLPPDEYNRQQFDEQARALRLYLNLLDRFLANTVLDAFNGALGGNGITFPHIAASDSTDQLADGDDTPTVVTWNTLDSGFGWTLNAPGSATADVAGVYKITYSIQVANTDNTAPHSADFWLRINGTTDVPNSCTTFSVGAAKSNSIPTFICAYSEVTFTVGVGDTIELYWATGAAATATSGPTRGIYLFHDDAQVSPYARPAIPSAIGSIVWVSAIPPA